MYERCHLNKRPRETDANDLNFHLYMLTAAPPLPKLRVLRERLFIQFKVHATGGRATKAARAHSIKIPTVFRSSKRGSRILAPPTSLSTSVQLIAIFACS